jgi:antitoxin component YwqK of YwqJK toxin-antitoxin module
MARILCLLIISFFSLSLSAQNQKIIKYYDSLWSPALKETAYFYTEFVKQDSIYNCYSYWMKSKKLNCRSVYADTLFSRPKGLLLRYYENGQVQDSNYFFENGQLKNAYHYYPSGKLRAHYYYDSDTKKEISEGFNESGKSIKGFVYMKEAEFPGGLETWSAYLSNNLKTQVPIKNGAPNGTYEVIIAFCVDKNGGISDIEAKTNFGYGMEEEAIRVIKKSPRWRPLVFQGKEEKAYRLQPITFVVTGKPIK